MKKRLLITLLIILSLAGCAKAGTTAASGGNAAEATPAGTSASVPTDTPEATPTGSPANTAASTPTSAPTSTPTSTPSPTPLVLKNAEEMTDDGIDAGISFMVKEILGEICCRGEDTKKDLLSIHNWVSENIESGMNLYEDEKKSAYTGLLKRCGDEVTKNAVFAVLAEEYGIEHMRVSAADPSYNHSWNLCRIDGEWYHFDFFVPGGGHYVCFMQTEDQVKAMTSDLYPIYHYYDLPEGLPERSENRVYNGYFEYWTDEPKPAFTEEYILSKISELKEKYPSGKYWNHGGVSDEPCNHKEGIYHCNRHDSVIDALYVHGSIGDQCRGFASLLSDEVFGKEIGAYAFTNYDELRVGDLFRIMFRPGTEKRRYHAAMIIEKTDEYVVVAEANYDFVTCKIRWGAKYTKEYLESCGTWYITRDYGLEK
ncbi:MAG: transglutaminase-like domain-containing protein [Lachnospiraceae bacterium]|nr:transglutaminase-like domain-containing protein [Lachnospiraceae bacterium]